LLQTEDAPARADINLRDANLTGPDRQIGRTDTYALVVGGASTSADDRSRDTILTRPDRFAGWASTGFGLLIVVPTTGADDFLHKAERTRPVWLVRRAYAHALVVADTTTRALLRRARDAL